MNKEEAKASWERAVFRNFAAAARLPVVPDSIESRSPPEPDILCEYIDGDRVAFELVELVDQGLAHVTARALADPDDIRAVWFDDPTFERIREKLTRKEYTTPHPMELLAHGGDTLLWREAWASKYEQRLRRLFDVTGSGFRRLWVVNLGRLAASDPVWLVHPAR